MMATGSDALLVKSIIRNDVQSSEAFLPRLRNMATRMRSVGSTTLAYGGQQGLARALTNLPQNVPPTIIVEQRQGMLGQCSRGHIPLRA